MSRFKPVEDEVAMTISFDPTKKSIKLEFFSSDEITGAELLLYLSNFVQQYAEKTDEIYDDGFEEQRIVN